MNSQKWWDPGHGLVFKAHRLVYHSTLGVRVMKKKDPGHVFVGVDSAVDF